jgi:CDP-2,3-bis-(O-geranylgeranyl)-sn-glycerol synthase
MDFVGPMMAAVWTFVSAFWIMVPAYLPNSAAAVFGGGTPVDFGKTAKDGRRILGDGKTWWGLAGGILAGIAVGLLQILLRDFAGLTMLPPHTVVTVTALAAGALLGDMAKSYFKRRAGKDRGEKWPAADMYDFVAGSLLLLCICAPVWVSEYLTLWILLAILVLTPVLHRGVNIIGYLIGVKDVPW